MVADGELDPQKGWERVDVGAAGEDRLVTWLLGVGALLMAFVAGFCFGSIR